MLEQLGYSEKVPVFYHFLLPEIDINIGLVPLVCDGDVHVFGWHVKICKELSIYYEHDQLVLATYGKSPLKSFLSNDALTFSPEFQTKRNRGSSSSNCTRKLIFDLNLNATDYGCTNLISTDK